MKTAFLDRDGVINIDRGEYTFLPEHFELVPDVSDALGLLYRKGYSLIVVTNQGGISKGLYTAQQVKQLHTQFCDSLQPLGIRFTDIFFCPYHDEISRSIWRKPDSGMLERAMAIYQIKPKEAVFIGDAQRDMDAATRVCIKGIQTVTNHSWKHIAEIL